MAETKKMNLLQKINAVMKDVEYLSKDDKVEFGSTKYKAVSEEKVTSAVRKSMANHGLVIFPVEQAHSKEGNLTTVNVKYKLADIDTDQFEIIVSSGTGVDTQDKGVGKAMTYAFKYALLRTFAIPTGEDPDKISSAEWDEKLKDKGNKDQAPGKGAQTTGDYITEAQRKRLFALAGRNGTEIVKQALLKKGITNSEKALKSDYDSICAEISEEVRKKEMTNV
jgi:hypothetical protein